MKYLKIAIAMHMATDAHSKSLTEKERKGTRQLRRSRVGLTITRTTLQIVREGNNYMQFEEKLHSLHLTYVDIKSLNNSKESIKAFVESMTVVMDRKIERRLHAVDAVTGQKRIFLFMADTFTEPHKTGDAVALMAM